VEGILDVGRQLTVRHDGNLLAVYRYGDVPKPYFHPILLGDGTDSPLTLASPHDHLHHRGLWFCWKFVNGENFWEEEPVCHQVLTRYLHVDRADAEGVSWTSHLDWQTHGGRSFLAEHRILTINRPEIDTDSRHYTIDFALTFRPNQPEVHLSLLTVREQPWGGYAGLGYRPARGMDARWHLLTSNGPATTADKGVPARWADYSGGLDGAPRTGGIALFDHPTNVRHPPPFFVISPPAFGFLNPSPLFHEGLTLHEGESLSLHYRALVHAGPGDASRIESAYQRWVSGS
jgi:hypothetical protein